MPRAPMSYIRAVPRRAFTLIELLVVIAIVAVLAAILFPVFARAKAAAGDAVTISNARQLGDAFLLYLGDADDVLPPACDGGPGESRTGGWTYYSRFGVNVAGTFDVTKGAVYPYANSAPIFRSPADADSRKSGDSFAFNGALGDWSGTGLNPSKPLGAVAVPADTMLIAEEGTGEETPFGYGFSHGTNDGYLNPSVDHFARFHPGGAAVAYCDGHVKIVQAQDRFVRTVCGSDVVCFR